MCKRGPIQPYLGHKVRTTKEIAFLGYVVNAQGIEMDEEKVKAIQD
jgi:hypothetical protein